MQPLRFSPILKSIVWGGENIAPFKSIDANGQSKIGESWEVSGVAGMESVVDGSPLDGKSLNSILSRELLGNHVLEKCGGIFPLLIKLIDAAQDLSVQVHPSDELALRRHGTTGKTEMWYVVDATPGAKIYSGLSRPVSSEDYDRMVYDGSIMEALACHDAAPGDVFHIPAGRVHAIGRGCFIAEIQQTSDLGYRLYDHGRMGLDGKLRQLHTDLAKEAIDYAVLPSYRTEYQPVMDEEVVLVRCRYFVTSLFDLGRPVEKAVAPLDSFLSVMCIAGEGTVIDEEPEGNYKSEIRRGQTLVIPASSRSVRFEPSPSMKLITSYVP